MGLTSNETVLKFKENLHTDDYAYWYEKVYEAYKGLLGKNCKINGIPNDDLFNEFVCRLPDIVKKWKPNKSQFSTYLTIWLKGNVKPQFIVENCYPIKYSRAPRMRDKYKVSFKPLDDKPQLQHRELNPLDQLLYNELKELVGDFESAYKSGSGMGKRAKEEYKQVEEIIYGKD